MTRLSTDELGTHLTEMLERVREHSERVVFSDHGEDVAALVSISDLEALQELIDRLEDQADLEALKAALAEEGEDVPYEEVRRKLGLASR